MMKKPLSTTERSINAILEDEEMEEYFRKLVEKSIEKGICLSNLQKVSKFFWDKYSPKTLPETQEQELAFTAKETEFFQKIDAFWEKFGKDIMIYLAEDCRNRFYTDSNFYKLLFKTMYLVFEKEDSVTIPLLKKYENQYFHTSRFKNISVTHSKDLEYLFNSHFYFQTDENGKSYPMFFSKFWEAYQKKARSFYDHPGFKEFSNKYKIHSHSYSKIAMYVIWFVNEFF